MPAERRDGGSRPDQLELDQVAAAAAAAAGKDGAAYHAVKLASFSPPAQPPTNEAVAPPARDLHFKVEQRAVGGDGVVGAHRRRIPVVRARPNIFYLRKWCSGLGRSPRRATCCNADQPAVLQRQMPRCHSGSSRPAAPACHQLRGSVVLASGCCHPMPRVWAAAVPTWPAVTAALRQRRQAAAAAATVSGRAAAQHEAT